MIPYGRHFIDQRDIENVVDVLKSDWLTCGPIVEKFEQKLAATINANYVLACANATMALHLALISLGIGVDDVVLVPAITFLASANAVLYVGAMVVFVDVDADTGLMTAGTLEQTILLNKNKRLKAVINVHLAGQCEDLAAIYNMARKYNLLIIEDAAHAIGTIYIDQHKEKHCIGANKFSDITVFSFHPVKTIAMGEGGAIAINDEKIMKKIKLLRSHGMERDPARWKHKQDTGAWYYEMQDLGYNYRISDINCALGIGQLEKLEKFKITRKEMVKFYDDAFAKNKYIKPIRKLIYSDPAWHLYVVLINYGKSEKTRAQLMLWLQSKGIGTQVHYIPVYKQPYYKKLYGENQLVGAELYYSQCLSLPLYVGLKNSEQKLIVKLLNEYVG